MRGVLAAAALLAAACASGAGPVGATTVPPLHPSVDAYPEAVVVLEGDGREVPVAVKVAATAAHRRHGLMEVTELPDGVGMLFLFATPTEGAFWMKDTLLPLSIAFVEDGGAIVRILDMEPCREEPCALYSPGADYVAALEVPQGWFEEAGVDEDWRVALPEALPPPE